MHHYQFINSFIFFFPGAPFTRSQAESDVLFDIVGAGTVESDILLDIIGASAVESDILLDIVGAGTVESDIELVVREDAYFTT